MYRRTYPTLALALLLALFAACGSGGASGGSSSSNGSSGNNTSATTSPCDPVRLLVLNGALKGIPATLVQALRISLNKEVAPSTCDFTNYPGSPGIAEAVARALASRAQTDIDAALRLIEDRVAAIQRAPQSCAPRPAYPCTTELAWLATQAAKLPGGNTAASGASGGGASGGSSGGGAAGIASRGAAASFAGEAQAATGAAASAPPQPTSSGSAPPGAPRPVSASEANTQAAANAQAHGQPPGPWLDKAGKAAEAEALTTAANNSKCNGGPAELAAIAQAAARVQQLNGSESVVTDVMRAAQPVIKSMARQQASGVDVGMTFAQLYQLALGAGIDVSRNNWMDDPTCAERWTLHIDHEVRMDIAGGGGTLIERWLGTIALELQPNGSGAGVGRSTYTGRMTNSVCNWQGDAKDIRSTFGSSTPRAGRLTGSVRIESASGNTALQCEGVAVTGAAGSGAPSFLPKVDMPFQSGVAVRPPADDIGGFLAQAGFTITTIYTLTKG